MENLIKPTTQTGVMTHTRIESAILSRVKELANERKVNLNVVFNTLLSNALKEDTMAKKKSAKKATKSMKPMKGC